MHGYAIGPEQLAVNGRLQHAGIIAPPAVTQRSYLIDVHGKFGRHYRVFVRKGSEAAVLLFLMFPFLILFCNKPCGPFAGNMFKLLLHLSQ
jgi:hypothetical protein